MKRPKISRRAETRPYGRVSAPTRNCRRFLTQLRYRFSVSSGTPRAVPGSRARAASHRNSSPLVVDHHIVRRQHVQVGQCHLALISMRMQVEVDR